MEDHFISRLNVARDTKNIIYIYIFKVLQICLGVSIQLGEASKQFLNGGPSIMIKIRSRGRIRKRDTD